MSNIFRYIRRGIVFVMLGGIAVYAGMCVYANFAAGDGSVKLPSVDKARYAVQIQSTGQVVFANKYDRAGSIVTVHGYYEYSGSKFRWHKDTLPLDESLFGPIKVSVRQTE